MDLGPTEMALPTLYHQLQLFRSNRVLQSVPPRWLCQLSVALLQLFWSYRDVTIGATETRIALPLHIGHSELFPFGSTETSKVHIFCIGQFHREF